MLPRHYLTYVAYTICIMLSWPASHVLSLATCCSTYFSSSCAAGNATIDSDAYELREGGYFLYVLQDLDLGAAGTIPANTSLNSCILTWVGKHNGIGFRIKST